MWSEWICSFGWYCAPAAAVLLIYLLWEVRARKLSGLPSSPFLPFIGSLHMMHANFHTIHDAQNMFANEVGDGKTWTTGFLGFKQPLVYLPADAGVAEHVLKTNFNKYIKPNNMKQMFQEFLGNGIFNVDGDEWRKQRKIASYMFSARSLKEDMSLVFDANKYIVLQLLDKYATNHTTFDIQDLYFRFTLDSFMEIAFGEKSQCLSMKETPFAVAFDLCQAAVTERFFDPTWRVQRLLHVGRRERLIHKTTKIIDEHALQIIEREKNRADKAENIRPDLLSRFILDAERRNEPIDDRALRDICINFIIAGRDTTAILMSWSTYELTQHPDIEEKLYQEIISSGAADDSQVEPASGRKLSYLHAFLYEVLRLHPPVPFDAKECIEEDVWPDDNSTRIPVGTIAVYAPYIFGRSKRLWGEDALEFNPDRWFRYDPFPTQYQFIVFNAGPRLCLGKSVAIVEASHLLSSIIRQFRFQLQSSLPINYVVTLTCPIKNGLQVTVTKR